MKRFLAILLTALLLPRWSLAAEGEICFDEQLHVYCYGSVSTPEGNTVLAISMRDKENRTAGENPSTARLICVGPGGEVLWDRLDGTDNANIYCEPALLSDGTLLILYHHYKEGTELNEWELRKFSMEGELLATAPVADLLPEGTDYVRLCPFADGAMISSIKHLSDDRRENYITLVDVQFNKVYQLPIDTRWWPSAVYAMPNGLAMLSRLPESDGWDLRFLGPGGEPLGQYAVKQGDNSLRLSHFAPDGTLLLCSIAWDTEKRRITQPAEVIRMDANGRELERVTLQLPETEDREVTAEDLLVTQDEILLLCSAKTDTCLRLLRFDPQGRLTGSVDVSSGEDVYRGPQLAWLGDQLYASASVERNGKVSAVLVPLSVQEGR